MITNFDLENIAHKENIPLIDVFMKDKPPSKIYEGGYIINLQDAEQNEGGSHYTALFIPSHQKIIGYMDSFGFPPPQSTINWIKKSSLRNYKIAYNTKQIQNINSGGCGIYSLFFIQYMSKQNKKLSIEDAINNFSSLFDDDTSKNLNLLKQYAPYYMNSD